VYVAAFHGSHLRSFQAVDANGGNSQMFGMVLGMPCLLMCVALLIRGTSTAQQVSLRSMLVL
jgi:hypothetical protein